MSTVVGYQGNTDVDITYLACVKGSPEVLKSMFVDAPMDYDDAYLQMARRGARVLALGQKSLGRLSHQQVSGVPILHALLAQTLCETFFSGNNFMTTV